MKRFLALMALGLGLVLGQAGWAADPLEGLWKTAVDDGAYALVEVHPCGDKLCGTIMRTFNDEGEYKSPNIGKDIIRDMVPQGNGRYKGKVWRPSNDKIYLGKLVLSGNTLTMKGCIVGGLICASQTWTRVQ